VVLATTRRSLVAAKGTRKPYSTNPNQSRTGLIIWIRFADVRFSDRKGGRAGREKCLVWSIDEAILQTMTGMDDHRYQLILIALIGCGRRARRLMEHGADIMCGSRWLDYLRPDARTNVCAGRTDRASWSGLRLGRSYCYCYQRDCYSHLNHHHHHHQMKPKRPCIQTMDDLLDEPKSYTCFDGPFLAPSSSSSFLICIHEGEKGNPEQHCSY
jgi:hypothetical protein